MKRKENQTTGYDYTDDRRPKMGNLKGHALNVVYWSDDDNCTRRSSNLLRSMRLLLADIRKLKSVSSGVLTMMAPKPQFCIAPSLCSQKNTRWRVVSNTLQKNQLLPFAKPRSNSHLRKRSQSSQLTYVLDNKFRLIGD